MNVTANAAHPGAVKTELGRNFFNRGVTGMNHILQCTLNPFSTRKLISLSSLLLVSNNLDMLDLFVNLSIIKIFKLSTLKYVCLHAFCIFSFVFR